MIERVHAFLDAHGLNSQSALLVAVSGGVDSMVLMDVLLRLGFRPAVAHMNFGLRGAASDADEQFVQAYCKANDLTFHTKQVSLSKGEGESTQMQARALRYDWFKELMTSFGYMRILTAHHLNDSLETTLLNLTKGTGIAGLTGIPVDNHSVVRPLGMLAKMEVEAYAKTHGLAWREDASNQSTTYQRNKIRHKVIPVLEEINPGLTDTFKHTLERLQGTAELLNGRVNELRDAHLIQGEQDELALSWLTDDSVGWLLLSELLRPYGVSYTLAKEMAQSMESGRIFLTATHRLLINRGTLLITKEIPKVLSLLTIERPGHYVWGRFEVTVETRQKTDFHKPTSEAYAFFDADRVGLPFEVRSWQQGDTFVPLGMSGKKKLSDFMIDTKIPLTLKAHIPVFVFQKEIFWLGGYRVDDRFKVTPQTQQLMWIKLSHRE